MRKVTVRGIVILFLVLLGKTAFSQKETGGKAMQSIEIEAGAIVTLKADAEHGQTFHWFKNGKPVGGSTTALFRATEPGVYTVLAYSVENCNSVMSDGVEISIKQPLLSAEANLSIVKKSESKNTSVNEPYEYLISVTNKGPEKATDVFVEDKFPEGLLLKDVTMALNGKFDYKPENRTLSWRIDSLALNETAELRFRAESLNPGTVTNRATVSALEKDPVLADNESIDNKAITDLIIPNVFTPNGDGVNDRFEIKNLHLYKESEISIINRWGNSVYEKKGYENIWDGNGLDEGTYFFVLKVKNATCSWKAYKGYITLLRTKTQ